MNKKKTINIVCHYSSIYGGNFIPSILELTKNLGEYQIIFTFPNDAKDREWCKYLIDCGHEVCFINFSSASFKKELKTLNKNKHVDVLYTHFISGLRVKMIYPLSKKIKIIIHVHSDFTGGKKENCITKIKNFIEHHIIRKDARYIFVSQEMHGRYKKHNNYVYIRNALALNRIPCKSSNVESLMKDNNIELSDTVFLVFAWSPFVKGIDVALKGFLAGSSNIDNNKLVIVHGKNDGYTKCVNYLIEKLGNNNFLNDKRIVFLPPSEDVFSYYKLADVFISSSRSEGFSYSILESLLFNLDVLCSDIAGTSWAMKYQNVESYKVEDVSGLANLIKKHASFKKPLTTNNDIEKEYSIEEWSNSVFDIINK